MCGHRFFEIFDFHVFVRTHLNDAGIVDQHIDAEIGGYLRYGFKDLVVVGHVTAEGGNPHTKPLKLALRFGQLLFVARQKHDIGTLGGEAARQLEPKPA